MNRFRWALATAAVVSAIAVFGPALAAEFIQLATIARVDPKTGAILDAKTPYKGPCPVTLKFVAGFEGSAPKDMVGKKVTVKYVIVRSDGAKEEGIRTPTVTLLNTTQGPQGHFKEIWNDTWALGAAGQTYSGWVMLKTLSPTERESSKAAFEVICAARRHTPVK